VNRGETEDVLSRTESSYGAPIGNGLFVRILLLDALMYATLFWRDYEMPGQMLVAHYISFVAITDLGALFLPRDKRHWFNLFRFTSSVSFLVIVVALWAKGLDGEAAWLTVLRCALILTRMVHSGRCLFRHGPWLEELRGFPSYVQSYYRKGNTSERLGCWYLAIGAALLYFPHLAYWTHFNSGEARLDDILTGLQAQAGLNFCIKLFVFEVLVSNAFAKLMMRSVVAFLFVVQWPLMLGMFYLAPIPIAHAAVELYEVILVVIGYRTWRDARRVPARA